MKSSGISWQDVLFMAVKKGFILGYGDFNLQYNFSFIFYLISLYLLR